MGKVVKYSLGVALTFVFSALPVWGENDFKPRTLDYEREVVYQSSPRPGAVKDAPFLEIFYKTTKFSWNPHLAEGYFGLRDNRRPAQELTRGLTEYCAPSLSPDRRSLAYFDFVHDEVAKDSLASLHYRLNVYDLDTRKRTVVFYIANGQTSYYVWLSDNTLFVQYYRVGSDAPRMRSFAWLQRDGKPIYSMTVPIGFAIVDEAAVAYTRDGHQYFRHDRVAGEKAWFRCEAQTEVVEYNPPKPLRVARFDVPDKSENSELKIPCERGCVAHGGWTALPRMLGCTVEAP